MRAHPTKSHRGCVPTHAYGPSFRCDGALNQGLEPGAHTRDADPRVDSLHHD